MSDVKNQTILTPRSRKPYLDLLLISFLILFFELACIRFFGSMVVFLTFFTNITLMACFLGMSVGCMTATRKINFINWVLPLTFFTTLAALALFVVYQRNNNITIDVGNQKSPQLIYFGTEYRPKDASQHVISMCWIAGFFFSLIAMMFVGLGQVMGRAFDVIPNRIGAYTANVFGSLLGIVGFFDVSWFHLSPHVWFLVCVLICLYFVKQWTPVQILAQVGILFVVAIASYGVGDTGEISWSPYYKIRYTAQTGEIDTNNISHQQMIEVRHAGPAYMLPHLLNRDAGGKPFGTELIIGAGSGNDVAAANASGVGHIDAVEIDPVINSFGKQFHPDRPYANQNVKIWYDDGRTFLHKDHGQYDLAVYALVDSLVLHSGFSSLRLENFLFTQQAFEDVKAKLKPGGVFAMYNYYRQWWVIGRLAKMAQMVFKTEPLVVSLPYRARFDANSESAGGETFLLVGLPDASGKNPTIEAIRAKFSAGDSFWLNPDPSFNADINGFAHASTDLKLTEDDPANWQRIAPAIVDTQSINVWPTDNWPFLYLVDKTVPVSPNQYGIYMIAGISIVILLAFTWPIWFGPRSGRAAGSRILPSGRMFFLGAGFMLLETKGVVHMALLFGSTWIVNSVVFFAILVMILLANLFVILIKPKNLMPYYLLLIATLLVNVFVPMDRFLSLPGAARLIVSPGVVFIPIFFAGVIFSTSFRDSEHPDIAMGSNIAGVILGGLSENLSMMIGFNYLVGIAVGFYLLSWLLKPRSRDALSASPLNESLAPSR